MKFTAAALAAAVLAGCGGTTNSPLLGTGQSPRVRTLNLTAGTLTSEYTSSANPIGSMTTGQITSYQTEGEGSNTIIFLNAGNPVVSSTNVFQFSNFYTTSAYTLNGQYQTFTVVDNNIALDNGTSQIRGVNADTTVSGNTDVYVTPGSFNNPTLVAGNLISGNSGGLAFGAATSYKSESPGTYTVTCTPTGQPGTRLLNQVVTLQGGQSISVYEEAGATSVTTVDDEGG